MKWIERLKIVLIFGYFCGLFSVVCMMMIFSKLWPQEMPENKFISYFLKNITIETVVANDFGVEEYSFQYSIIEE